METTTIKVVRRMSINAIFEYQFNTNLINKAVQTIKQVYWGFCFMQKYAFDSFF